MKDIYELLSEINIDSSDIEEMEVSEFEREKGKKKLMNSLKRKKSNKKKIVVAVASLFLVSLVLATVVTPTWAENIPIIGELMKKRLVDTNKKYEDYMNAIGQTKSQNGIDVTFENAVADNNMFTFSFTVKNNNAEIDGPEMRVMPITLKINGKEIDWNGSSREAKVVDKNTVKYLWKFPWDEDLPRYLNVEIGVRELFNTQGDWGAKFSMDTKDVKEKTYTKKLDNKFTANGIKFALDEITISPLTTNIKYYGESDNYHDARLSFLILDQDGNEVNFAGGISKNKDAKGGEEGKIKSSMNYINNENISSLKLIPIYYDKNYSEKIIASKKINPNNFSPFELKLTGNITICIEDIKIDGENLIVKYSYEYAGKKLLSGVLNDFDIKADGALLEEDHNMDLDEKYISEDSQFFIYKIGDKAKDIEIEFNDSTANRLQEKEAITIVKK